MLRLRRLSGLCSSNVSDTANRLRNDTVVKILCRSPFSTLTQSTICTQATPQGKRVFKEGRNRRCLPFLFPRRTAHVPRTPQHAKSLAQKWRTSLPDEILHPVCRPVHRMLRLMRRVLVHFCRIDGLSIAPAATIETTAPAIAPVAMPETKGEIRIKDLPPFIKFIESVCPLVPQILHSKKMLVWHNRLFTIAGSYYIIYLTIRL